MRNIFQANMLFYVLVFFCALLILSQFSIKAFAQEPPKVLSEHNSGCDMVGNGSLDMSYFILKIGFKHCMKFFKSVNEFLCGGIESFFGSSSFGKEMIEICGHQNTYKGNDRLGCTDCLWHNWLKPMLLGFIVYSVIHIFFFLILKKCRLIKQFSLIVR